MERWTENLPESEIKNKVTEVTVDFASRFGAFLGKDETEKKYDKSKGKEKTVVVRKKLSTSQLRKFFGEVKRQQMVGYDKTDFVLLKPKLAYAVGRADKGAKIEDFYHVLSAAIDCVSNKEQFANFIKVFEAIVAYHKMTEALQK